MSIKTNCPVCQSRGTTLFLVRDRVPIWQNTLVKKQLDAFSVPRGDLKLVVCERCGFVFNSAFDSSIPIYGSNYDNAQFFSQVFEKYLSRLAIYLIEELGVRNCRVIEIGCGDGYFLKKLVEQGNNVGIGFDPSYTGPPDALGGRLHFEQSYYGPEQANIPTDVVICRHVIEHVPEPRILLNAVRQALSNSPSAFVFFETPTVEWILLNRTFWDFFYEHCSIFAAESLTAAFQLSGFEVKRLRAEFGGQYLWMEAGLSSGKDPTAISYHAGDIPRLAKDFSVSENRLRQVWKNRLHDLTKDGQVAIWGAGAKGATFANLIDSDRRFIACIVDVNPRKQGHYLSGTGHPIIDFRELASYGITSVIVMNPNYYQEIEFIIKEMGLKVQLFDLTDEMES